MSKAWMLALAFLTGVGLTWLVIGSDRGPRRAQASPELADRPPIAHVPEKDVQRSPVAVMASEPVDSHEQRTARESLAEYWGANWPEREKAMLEAGLDLDQAFEVTPWESVADSAETAFHLNDKRRALEAQTMIDWPAGDTAEDLGKGIRFRFAFKRPLSEEDVWAIQDLASRYNEKLVSLSSEYIEGLDQALYQRWVNGDFVKAPFSSVGLDKDAGFYGLTGASGSWAFSVGLLREDYPYLMTLQEQARGLAEQRDWEVRRYLGEQGYLHILTSIPDSER